jgi:hypothetical protein
MPLDSLLGFLGIGVLVDRALLSAFGMTSMHGFLLGDMRVFSQVGKNDRNQSCQKAYLGSIPARN